MFKNKGQLQISVLAAGGFILASLTLAVSSFIKSGEAMEKTAEIKGEIMVMNNRLENIEKILERWQEIQIKDGKLTKDGLPK